MCRLFFFDIGQGKTKTQKYTGKKEKKKIPTYSGSRAINSRYSVASHCLIPVLLMLQMTFATLCMFKMKKRVITSSWEGPFYFCAIRSSFHLL